MPGLMTHICRRPGTDIRTREERQEAALLAAFRRLGQRERFKLVRFARLRRSWRIVKKEG